MDIDRRLHQSGERWRAEHSTPLSPPAFEEESMPARRRTVRVLAPLAVAAVVIAIIVIVATVAHPSRSGPVAHPAGPSAKATALPTPAVSPSPAAPAANCAGAQLTASVGRAGPANGTENIFILLHNTSANACQLGGILPLTGVRADGTTVSLAFEGSTDPGVADPGPVTGPGPVPADTYGTFHVTVGLSCAPPTGTFTKLRIGLGAAQYVEMPYPPQFALGCAGHEAPAGPISSLDALGG
jgi:hypothetical protein